jgi:hypothetical protein
VDWDEKGAVPPAGAWRTSVTAESSMITPARVIFFVMLVGSAALLAYALLLLTGSRPPAPAADKPNDPALLAMIADAKRTADDAKKTADDAKTAADNAKKAADDAKKAADDAAAAATRNNTALAALGSDVQTRFSATEALIRKAAEDEQARFDAIDRRFQSLERTVASIKPPALPIELSLEMAKGIQRTLQTRGFRPGPIDGVFGPRTAAAIRVYQTRRGDHPAITGILNDDQIRDLLQ